MKKILSIFFFIVICYSCFSQKYKQGKLRNYQYVDYKKIHFGFSIGINYLDLSIKNAFYKDYKFQPILGEQVKFSPGFTVAIVSDLKLNENLNLRFLPGLTLGKRNVAFSNTDTIAEVETVYLDFPLLLKYKANRVNNFRPYIIGGISYRRDLEAKSKLSPNKLQFIKFNSNDVFAEFGFGIDSYLPYFKFSTEIRVSIGFLNIINKEPDKDHLDLQHFSEAFSRVNSNVVSLIFHFE